MLDKYPLPHHIHAIWKTCHPHNETNTPADWSKRKGPQIFRLAMIDDKATHFTHKKFTYIVLSPGYTDILLFFCQNFLFSPALVRKYFHGGQSMCLKIIWFYQLS